MPTFQFQARSAERSAHGLFVQWTNGNATQRLQLPTAFGSRHTRSNGSRQAWGATSW